MSDEVNAWLADFEALVAQVHARAAREAQRYNEIEPIVERAFKYCREMYDMTGMTPNHFLVTAEEYTLLQRYQDRDDSETRDRYPEQMRIWGMSVRTRDQCGGSLL
jgi:hypothetical protein